MVIPTLTTPQLIMRPYTMDDKYDLHRIMNEENIMQYFPNPNGPDLVKVERFIQFQAEHWEKHGYGWWALVPRAGDRLIGWCWLNYLDETNETEVGYLLSRKYWGRGMATEAAKASLRYGFYDQKIDSIIGLTHPDNIGSQKVLMKCGMTYMLDQDYFGICLKKYSITRDRFLELGK